MNSATDRYAAQDSPVHRLDARAKSVACLFLLLCAISTRPNAYLAFAGYALLVFGTAYIARLPLRFLFSRALIIVPFALMAAAFAPFLTPDAPGGGYSLGVGAMTISRTGLGVVWNVFIKAALGVLILTLLTATTPMSALLDAAERLRVPRVVVMLAGLTYRYLFVVGDEARRMKRARDARGYRGRWIGQARVIGQLAGVLFLRSYARAERVHLAMLSRGFTGHFPGRPGQAFAASDALFTIAAIATAALLRWSTA